MDNLIKKNSEIVPHEIKIYHASNHIPNVKYSKIAILANAITVQANHIDVGKMPEGRFSRGHVHIWNAKITEAQIFSAQTNKFDLCMHKLNWNAK